MADLVRVYSTIPPSTISNKSVPVGTAFEVRLSVEAESAEFAAGGAYSAGAIAINRTTGAVPLVLAPVAGSPAYGAAENMGPATLWDPELDEFRYTVPAAFGAANDIIEIMGFVTVGAGALKETHTASTYVIRA
jgi:hypothetical protein